MGPHRTFRCADVHSIYHTSDRSACAHRFRAAALHGPHRDHARQKESMDLSLFSLCAVECHHDILGVQCDGRRRSFRDFRQCLPDVTGLRALPSEQEEVFGLAAVHLPRCRMDRMGEVLFRRRDIMAMACARQRLRPHDMGHTVVRIHRSPRWFAVGMGLQSRHFRLHGQPFGRKLGLL